MILLVDGAIVKEVIKVVLTMDDNNQDTPVEDAVSNISIQRVQRSTWTATSVGVKVILDACVEMDGAPSHHSQNRGVGPSTNIWAGSIQTIESEIV